MKIWIISDLHLEVAPLGAALAVPDADVCVVAGDLCRGIDNGIRWIAKNIVPSMPCVYVAGNHEFYKGSIKEGLDIGRAAAMDMPGVHFLENDGATIGGIRFLGATLWTDFSIEGTPEAAMDHARHRMNDYRRIALQKKPWRRFVPVASYRMHRDSRQFLQAALGGDPSSTVVVTHHLPLPHSIPSRFKGDLLNAAYASDLSRMIHECSPLVWVHGHVHDSNDYVVGNTRVISNPRGYEDENSAFDPGKVIEIATRHDAGAE